MTTQISEKTILMMSESKTPKEQLLVKMLEAIQAQDPDYIKVIIPKFVAKKLASWMLIREDLIFIKSVAMELDCSKRKPIDVRNKTIETALWHSFIIIYGKCFTENKDGHSKLNPNDCFNSDTLRFREIHDKIMSLRHSFIRLVC